MATKSRHAVVVGKGCNKYKLISLLTSTTAGQYENNFVSQITGNDETEKLMNNISFNELIFDVISISENQSIMFKNISFKNFIFDVISISENQRIMFKTFPSKT